VAETGRYLYAVTRGLAPAALDGLEGLSGGVLELVEHDGLVAVVSSVDLEEYGEEGLRTNLERLEWLEATARAHDAVIQAVAAVGAVAPMRLATIFVDDTSLRRRLDEWHHALVQVLDRVEGRQEWSVKVITSPVVDPVTATAAETRPASGADYLRQKKAAAQQRATRETDTQRVAEQVHESLSGRSAASRVLPPQDPRLTGHQGTMILNAAYLVPDVDGEAFAKEAAACAHAHPDVELDVRGPWPPYSFAMLEQR
jgi:hypothetical protein